MKFIRLIFKKLGNHWYLDIPHDNPSALLMDPKIERMLDRIDVYGDDIISNICLSEISDIVPDKGLLQFDEKDLLRYFTTDDSFTMSVYIDDHKFKIPSELYSLIELAYKPEFHVSAYQIVVF